MYQNVIETLLLNGIGLSKSVSIYYFNYTGMTGGGHYTNPGRNADPICLPHDPQLGPVSGEGAFGAVFGSEYETNAFGNDLHDKDVPCAVCRTKTASSVLMIPGRSQCYTGWKMEYSGNLMSGSHGHTGASNYLCVDTSPDVLEGGARNDDGYLLYVVKAYCGSLKCPPYKQDTIVRCVVCSK